MMMTADQVMDKHTAASNAMLGDALIAVTELEPNVATPVRPFYVQRFVVPVRAM